MASPLVVRIRGGLGNQLFQYASALGIAAATGRPLRVDVTTGFARDIYRRSYRLDRLAEPPVAANRLQIGWAIARSYRRWKAFRVTEPEQMHGRGISYHPALLAGGAPRYLEAYLQSPRYFEAVTEKVRAALTPNVRASAEVTAASEAPHSVALHVRRKDYEPVLPVSYYRAAVERVRAQAPSAQFFVLGDDPDFVARELAWLEPKRVIASEGEDADLLDLALIAACRHRIVANSSFSWWGAWLSSRDGMVVAPALWWKGAPRPRDLFPTAWYVLDGEAA